MALSLASLAPCPTASGRKPRQTPTERIRVLETRLRSVKASLEILKSQNSPGQAFDVDKILKTVDLSVAPPSDDESSSDEVADKALRLNSMMGHSGRSFATGPWQTSFYGSYSGCSFVLRTLELFRKVADDNPHPDGSRQVISDLYEAPIPDIESYTPAESRTLPSQSTALDLLGVVFMRYSVLVQFLHEANFRDMVYRFYNESAVQFSASGQTFMPLFHAVMSLGLLYDVHSRRQDGCEYATSEATKHFLLARRGLDISQCADLISLQALLCLTIFLVSTSRITAAHTYLGVASSAATRLGLHKKVEEGVPLSAAQRDTRTRVFLSLLQLDLYVSLVLDIPGFINLDHIDSEIMNKLQPSTTGKLLYPFDITAESRAQFSASAKHLELLILASTGVHDLFYKCHRQSEKTTDESEFTSVDVKILKDIEQKYRLWTNGLSGLPAFPEDPETSASMKFELEMTFYLGQMALYQPFLHYLIPMAQGLPTTKIQSEHALACMKIAGITISRTDVMYQRGLLCPASWNSIYTLFLAVSCLLFLIATHPGTSRPSNAWKKGERGIMLLAAMRCVNNGAVKCLLIIKMLIQQLSHTVLFDVDHIVAATAGICPCSVAGSLPREAIRRSLSKDMAATTPLHSAGYPTPDTPLEARAIQSPWSLGHDHVPTLFTGSHDTFYRDADSILAEAQAMSMVMPMDSFEIFGGG
ncbi:Gypsy retrotransposon integrase-like protein 1 [Knufia peltigerae]|uniref:Gypsy retrotransposon integrase-like protein 1 n=1 Tax=Knufia peltigerae TaxID=1002370 RepID=A0AA38XSH7_9EURO|nr:Gypsy retrotransposon integrase-like protein 1 [Knufia peltigerae]